MQETEHDVRFSAAAYGSAVRVACDPCEWHAYVKTGDGRGFIIDDFRVIEQGHTSGRWVTRRPRP